AIGLPKKTRRDFSFAAAFGTELAGLGIERSGLALRRTTEVMLDTNERSPLAVTGGRVFDSEAGWLLPGVELIIRALSDDRLRSSFCNSAYAGRTAGPFIERAQPAPIALQIC